MNTEAVHPFRRVAVVAALWLVACGGGEPTPRSAPAPAPASALVVAADDLLDWAERQYPDLFPAGSLNQAIGYAGRSWTVRTYEGHWGLRHLGVDADGQVAGLGDFSGQQLLSYGALADYADRVRSGGCTDYPLADGCPSASPGRRLAVGAGRVLAIDARGHVLVWGDGIPSAEGALGGTPLAGSRALDTGLVARSVGTSGSRLMAVTAAGEVMAWGDLLDGERGEPYDARTPRATRRAVPLPLPMLQPTRLVQAETDAALRQDGSLWIHPGRRVAAAGGLEQIQPVRLAGLPPLASIMRGQQTDPAGPDSVAAIGLDGSYWRAHYGRYDDLAPAIRPLEPLRVDGVPALAQVDCGRGCDLLGRDGSVWVHPTFVSDRVSKVPDLAGIVQIAHARAESLALGADGRVWAWSYETTLNDRQELVYSFRVRRVDGLDDVVEVAAGGYAETTWLARRRDGSLWGWGANDRGQLAGASALAQQPVPVRLPGIAL